MRIFCALFPIGCRIYWNSLAALETWDWADWALYCPLKSEMSSLLASESFESLKTHFSKVRRGSLAAFENSNEIHKLDEIEYPA